MMRTPPFPGRLALQQRVLPAYRTSFVESLGAACAGGLSVFAGTPRPDETILPGGPLAHAQRVQARNWQPLPLPHPLFFCWQYGLVDWLQAWEPDVLVLEANPRYLSNRLAVRWARRHGRPVIGWGLGSPPPTGPLAGARGWLRRRALSGYDAMIAYSGQGAREYAALGIPARRVFVASNAVTPPPSRPPRERPPTYEGAPEVLFVGRLQARKRVDQLLRACAGLPPDLQPGLTIVGEGPAREELEAQAAIEYPAARFPGPQHGDALEPFFARADLFVLPGTGGLAVQQAMAHGLPVIVAEGDGTQSDLVRPGNGWLIRAGDAQTLQGALETALRDPARLRRMGQESYRIVREEINTEAMTADFLNAVRAVLSW